MDKKPRLTIKRVRHILEDLGYTFPKKTPNRVVFAFLHKMEKKRYPYLK